ncbi:MAG: transposase [Bacteroidota bacterium]
MCKKSPADEAVFKNLSEKFKSLQVKYEISGCRTINLYFEDESRFGLLTILRRMITAKGIKPVAPFLHRFDNLYLFGAFSPITGSSCLLEMPHCNSHTFQVFIHQMAAQDADEFKIVILDNGAFSSCKVITNTKEYGAYFFTPLILRN